MTWQQACDAIEGFDPDDRGEYPALVWYERQLDEGYDPEEEDN